MPNIKDGGPAFPREDYQADNGPGQRGMSLRDYFAAQAMAASIVRSGAAFENEQKCAEWAYGFSDAMLAAREPE